ncbi:tetratricopeptide repeat protein [Maribellus sediminis]|uniref:tetratricopeptide repeat protein n=1 Tax=Maribellus sediminis TaxID=2696285 RepID=UPI0014306DED|nr:tetratricopeptide repeat protein [Maribellus sediminis]
MEKVIEINNKGVGHFLNQEFDLAEKRYMQALEIDSANATTLNNLGLLYHQKKEYAVAEEYFLKALKVKEKATYFLNLANAQVFLRKLKDAEKNYKKALQLDPQNENANVSLAKFYESLKLYSDACQIWEKLVQQSGNINYQVEWAKNLMALGRFEAALSIIARHEWLETSAALQLYAGICEFNLKNYGLAEEAFRRSLAIEPDSFRTRHYLAVNYLSKGDSKSALKELTFLMRLHPENEKVKLDAVSVLLSLQQWNEARKLIEAILEHNPTNEKATEYLEILNKQNSK